MNKPTPGPWTMGPRDAAMLSIRILDAPRMMLAAEAHGAGGSWKEVGANAALIVAAVNACFKVNPDNPLAVAEALPELVEACRNIAKLFDEAKEQGYSISAASNSWADALGAALAKLEAKP